MAYTPPMSLFKNRKPVENEWRPLADDAAVPEGEKVVISLKRWRGGALRSRPATRRSAW